MGNQINVLPRPEGFSTSRNAQKDSKIELCNQVLHKMKMVKVAVKHTSK